MNFLRWFWFVAVVATAVATVAVAYAADPATIRADEIELDANQNARIYRGEVIFQQAEVVLKCDELITKYTAADELVDGKCSGRPAKFHRRAIDRGGKTATAEINARASVIHFDNRSGVVTLRGGAQIHHRGARLQGAKITYDLATEKTSVTGGDAAPRPYIYIPPPLPR